MTPETIDALFRQLSDSLPDPKTALNYGNHFQLLIAVILSAQSTDVAVNRLTPSLFKAAPTPKAMANLGEEGIRPHIRSLGLFNNKARNIFRCCNQLIEKHGSRIPDTRGELEELPGVGRKTAGVILNVAFGQPTIPVDTHVFRLANRTGLVEASNPLETERQLLEVVPGWVKKKAHHLLILHGRHVCKAQKPLCRQCRIVAYCKCPDKSV
ncbi:MAG: endonuclease III [Proteobacteria bacterium]|nr:endonuclease III [Pseudomonadota bacterium]